MKTRIDKHNNIEKLQPSLRFPEFEGEWEIKSLGEICKMQAGKFINAIEIKEKSNINKFPCYGGNGLRGYTNNFNQDGKYSLIGRQGAHCGNVNVGIGKFYATEHAIVVKLKDDTNTDFIFYILKNLNLNQYSTGLAQPGLSVQNLEKIETIISKSITEQTKIASFLTAVDDKLLALKQKYALLEQYKKGVMQKIFSQELRFKPSPIEALEIGDEYPDWEEKKLGDIMSIRNEQASKSDQYPLMAFIQNIGVAPKGDRYNREFLVNDGESKKYKKTEYGDFIYSSNNLETGSIGLNRYGSASISPVYSIFHVKQSINFEFISTFLVRKNFIYKMIKFRQGVVYGQWKIHESEFLKIQESIPCIAEQTKIASFLSTLDEKINQCQAQIEKTEVWKKGLLQQLFV